MKLPKPRTLHRFNLPDTKYIPDGYHMTEVPIASDRNFQILLDEYDKVVGLLEVISAKLGIELEEE